MKLTFGSARVDSPLVEAEVMVLFGGTSNEAEISRLSGRAVCEALADSARSGAGPGRVRQAEIRADGRWVLDGEVHGLDGFLSQLSTVDICFLALHGGDGEDGHLQALLELAPVPFTGSGLHAASLSMDKWNSRLVAEFHRLVVPAGRLLTRANWETEGSVGVNALIGDSPLGVCVKPRRGGSSVGVVHAQNRNAALEAAEAILEQGDDVVIERWTDGVEVACGVLGNRDEDLQALTPVEIRPSAGHFFDYREKYSASGAAELCPPEAVDSACCERLRERALTMHRALGCDGYSRSDFIVPRSAAGTNIQSAVECEPVFLELNSLPGLTPRSLLPLAATEAGIDFASLCRGILEAGLRKGARER